MGKKVKKVRPPKSDHKHEYKKCLVELEGFRSPAIGVKCVHCGKIKLKQIFVLEKDEVCNVYRMLNTEEIYEKYKDLEIVKGYKL